MRRPISSKIAFLPGCISERRLNTAGSGASRQRHSIMRISPTVGMLVCSLASGRHIRVLSIPSLALAKVTGAYDDAQVESGSILHALMPCGTRTGGGRAAGMRRCLSFFFSLLSGSPDVFAGLFCRASLSQLLRAWLEALARWSTRHHIRFLLVSFNSPTMYFRAVTH